MKVIESRRKRVNFKLVLILAMVVLLGWICIGWWHKRQVLVSSRQLFERGMAAKEAGNHNLAVEELGRYVGFAPNDTSALAEYTDSLYQVGSSRELREQIFALNEEILRRRPEEMQIRAVQADIALALSRIPDAASHVNIIEEYEPLTAPLLYVRGRCFEATSETDKAIESYEAALALDANHVKATEHLAELLTTKKGEQARADKLLSSLVTRTGSVDALLLKARRHAQMDQTELAIEDLRLAVRMAPENSVVVSAFGAAIHRQLSLESNSTDMDGLRREALTALRNRIADDSQNSPMRLYFARLLWTKEADRDEAVATLREGCELEINDETLLFALADSLISLGRLDEARPLLSRFSDKIDSVHKSSLLRSRIQMAEERWEDARATLATLIKTAPQDRNLLNRARLYIANCLRELKQGAAAATSFERALEDNPTSTEARLGLAESYIRNNQLVSAINEYRQLTVIPRVAAFLADLLIEAQTTKLVEPTRWKEIDALVGERSKFVPDPIERAVLRADRMFAEGKTREAWLTLTNLLKENPKVAEASQAVDAATSLMLDRLMEKLSKTEYDPEANAAFEMLTTYWATRADNGKLTGYFENPVETTGERQELLHRMTLTTFVASQLARRIRDLGGDSSALRKYADKVSQQLVRADATYLGQRLQLLASFGQKNRLFRELEAADVKVFGHAVGRVVPAFHGDIDGLNRLENLTAKRLKGQSVDVDLLNAEALIQSAKGNYDAAIKAWRKLHRQAPKHLDVTRNLVVLLSVHANEFEESGRIIEEALRDNPDDVTLLHAKACVKIAEGRLQEAEKILKAITTRNVHIPHLVHLSYTQAAQSRTGEARFTLDKVQVSGLARYLHPLDQIILKGLKQASAR
jgi:tetratricopeptide (TPR) repeat protein